MPNARATLWLTAPRARAILLTIAAVLAMSLHQAINAQDASPIQHDISETTADWFRPEGDVETLKRILEDEHVSDRWIYHDLDAARLEAQQTGKPILVVFRCVPCGSAPELDGAICTSGGAEASRFEAEIQEAGGKLDVLLDQFVAVRMVKMNGVNRNVFHFDRDVPYVAMFLNADGAVYGRYGTRVSKDRKNLTRHRLSSFQASLHRALKLHQGYRQNKTELKANRGDASLPAMAEDMATFVPFPAEHNPKVKDCIHCHTVGEAELRKTMADGHLALRNVWPYPLPNNVGLAIDLDDGLKVESVTVGSPAEQAGLRSGDTLVTLNGQPLTSEADVQWALHHAPDAGALAVVVRRGDREIESALQLRGDWRKSDGHWRSAIGPLRPHVHLRPDPYKVKKGAKPGHMGLAVVYPRGPAADAGLRNGDLLVEVDGRSDLHLEADVLKYIHFDRPDVESSQLTIIRKGSQSTFTLPIRPWATH